MKSQYLVKTYLYKIIVVMESRIKLRKIICLCICLAIGGMIYFGYLICALAPSTVHFHFKDNLGRPLPSNHTAMSYDYENDEATGSNDQRFDINAHDVMVFLHIQKTGGTSFGRHLVSDLDLQRPCSCQRKKKRCYCFRPNRHEVWLFSRYSTGWKCGLHADWTELTSCVHSELDKNEGHVQRRYFYISILREPLSRYLSEFKHVQRGATWRNSRHWCGGRTASPSELPKCYPGPYWRGVSLDEFADCPHNLATNRQTRMMADLSLVGCYNMSAMSTEQRNRMMLASAKRNLASMAYFALTEYQKIDQYVFEETFNMRFCVPFVQQNSTLSATALAMLTPAQLSKIQRLNALDKELYEFARSLMMR
ncbi:heparan-sulfate 6-O-sulfotransferase 1-A [Diaphorina citri]|uniref:Heparan-sulfate 6-O-sulfotransferase n=1 Tax=Diaphorina citri TaxID=121845 RepID=A0A1S3CYE8_DIACI|nr:heparan-sulfate 6-O-sulfotransferase 1-A [Diaphorina citri]